MSLTLTPASLADDALREIGATYWHESGAERPKLRIALRYLDKLMAELAGTERLWWLVPITLPYQLIDGQAEYDLSGTVSPDLVMVLRANLVIGEREEPLELLRRVDWDAIDDRLTATGRPTALMIEQSPASLMRPYPIPDDDYTVQLVGQTITPNVTESEGAVAHGWPTAWQRYLSLALAYDLGRGPIAQLPESELNRIRGDRDDAKFRLLARNRKENRTKVRAVAYRDF